MLQAEALVLHTQASGWLFPRGREQGRVHHVPLIH